MERGLYVFDILLRLRSDDLTPRGSDSTSALLPSLQRRALPDFRYVSMDSATTSKDMCNNTTFAASNNPLRIILNLTKNHLVTKCLTRQVAKRIRTDVESPITPCYHMLSLSRSSVLNRENLRLCRLEQFLLPQPFCFPGVAMTSSNASIRVC